MAISENNKAAFFEVQLTYSKIPEINQEWLEEILTVQMDLLLSSFCARKVHKFDSKNQDKSREKQIIYFFQTRTRKRRNQILKSLDDFIGKEVEKIFSEVPYDKENFNVRYQVIPMLKTEFIHKIRKKFIDKKLQFFSKELIFAKKLYNPRKELVYNGEDLQIFDDKKNWHPWQLELSEEIFYQTGEIRKANYRRGIYLWDPKGRSGKSTFYKFLNYKYYNKKSITYISMALANELISALKQCSHRQLYICDLSKLLALTDKTTLYLLFGIVEHLKNGISYTQTDKNYDLQLFSNPHVILSSNQLVSPDILSQDRWIIYKIDEELELIDVTKDATELFRKQEQEKEKEKQNS